MGSMTADAYNQAPSFDERTPLNATSNRNNTAIAGNASSDRATFQNSFDRFTRFSFSNPLPITLGRRGSGSGSDGGEDVDIDELQLDLARVGSFQSGGGLDPGRPLYTPVARPSRPIKDPSLTVREPNIESNTPNTYSELTANSTTISNGSTTDTITDGDPRFIGISPKRFWVIFLVIMLAYFIACFDSTLMASSHPVITSYFGASQAASWLSTVFLITSTAFQPLFGRVSDMVGRKSVLLVALLIFLLTTLWCALATSVESFIAARAVCGIGAGGTTSLCLIIISDLVRIEHRGVFQSHINVAFGAGSAAGAAFGGFLCDSLGWRWAFGIQVPVIALCLILAIFASPKDLGPMLIKQSGGSAWVAIKDFDFMGSSLLVTTVTCLILALNLGGNFLPWTHPLIIAFIAASMITAALFAFVENRVKQPLMPLRLLSKTPVANLVFSNFFGGIAMNTILFNVPLFFQAVLLTSASASGLRLAVPSMFSSFAGISTGYIITYTRKLKPTLVLGASLYMLGSVLVLLLNERTSELMSMILITGVPLGQGFVFPNTMMSALAVSEQSAQAVVTTTISLWRNLGNVVGVAISSLVFQNALVLNLYKSVTGPSRDEIIKVVRSSVESIRLLDPQHQHEVSIAYATSLRTTFLCALVAAILVNILIIPVHLPRLRSSIKIALPAGE